MTAAHHSDHFPVVAKTRVPGGLEVAWEEAEEVQPRMPLFWKAASSYAYTQDMLERCGRPDAGGRHLPQWSRAANLDYFLRWALSRVHDEGWQEEEY